MKALLISLLVINCFSKKTLIVNYNNKVQQEIINEKEIVRILKEGSIEQIKKTVNKYNINNIYKEEDIFSHITSFHTFALYEAIKRGNLEITKYLLSLERVNVNLNTQLYSPLTKAIEKCLEVHDSYKLYTDNLKIVELLVDKGASIYTINSNAFYNPLHFTIVGNHHGIVEIQLDIMEIFLKKNFKISICNDFDFLNVIFSYYIPRSYNFLENKIGSNKIRLDNIVIALFDKIIIDDIYKMEVIKNYIISIKEPVLSNFVTKKLELYFLYKNYVENIK